MLVLLVRSVIIYAFILLAVRLMGKRQIGQLQVTELAITIIISELAALPMVEEGTPLIRVVVPILLLCAFELLTSGLPVVFPKLSPLIDGTPSFLMNDGKLDRTEMRRQRVTMVDLCEAMRAEGYTGIDQLSAVVLETNGRLSVIPRAEHAPASAGQVLRHVDAQPGVPVTVVMDGAVHTGGLTFYGHDRQWLQSQLERRGLKLEDVFFMSVDGEEEIVTVLRRDVK
ncbi:MAG: DUF421 domain-containing protein [Clostridia bacterium]|nr:DUF421 domain-containing protein [Clostridia bacterium]